MKDDGHITQDDALSSFRFALSIHSATPRIEAHYQYYDTSVESSLIVAQDAACPVWVHFGGKQYCSPALDRAQQDIGEVRNPEGLPFDRILGPSPASGLAHSVLYADITSPLFAQFHQTVSSTARDGSTSYRIRYRPQASQVRKPLTVSGYGVELALKRTDYIVIDDRKAEGDEQEEGIDPANTRKLNGNMDGDMNGDGQDAVLKAVDEDISDLKPLSGKELAGIGLKTATFIMASEKPFETLIKLSQDFPKFSLALSKRDVSQELIQEHRTNRDIFLPSGYNVIWMNGQQVQSREIDAFALLQQIRRERTIVGNIRALGFSGSEAVDLLSHPAVAESKSETGTQRYDYRDSIDGGNIIIWLNDLEKDKRYRSWPNDVASVSTCGSLCVCELLTDISFYNAPGLGNYLRFEGTSIMLLFPWI